MADDKTITLQISDWDQGRLDKILGDAVVRRIEGCYYDEDGEEIGARDGLTAFAHKTIQKRVDEAIGDMLKARLHDLIEQAVRKAFDEGIEVPSGYQQTKKVTVAQQVKELLTERHFARPREMTTRRDSSLTLVEYIAFTHAHGQIDAEAKKLVEQMRESLREQIATNLSDQLAGRMLKGAG